MCVCVCVRVRAWVCRYWGTLGGKSHVRWLLFVGNFIKISIDIYVKLCSVFLQRTGVTLFSMNLDQIEADSDKYINNIFPKKKFKSSDFYICIRALQTGSWSVEGANTLHLWP